MIKLNLHWEDLHILSREEILSNACINTRMAHYKWDELDEWLQEIIARNLNERSKGTCILSG